MASKSFCVYKLTNSYNTVLYTGVTGNLPERVYQHKQGRGGVFTSKYKCTKLVNFEEYPDPGSAIHREKQIKGGSLKKKIDLIEGQNPELRDLAEDM